MQVILLSWPFPQTVGLVIADFNDITANQADLGVRLPNATLQPPGQSIIFNNIGTNPVFLRDFTGNSIIKGDGGVAAPLLSGKIVQIYLTGVTSAGVWQVIPYGSGVSTISALRFQATNDSILVNDGIIPVDISPPGGIIDLILGDKLTSLDDQLDTTDGL